MAIFLGNKKISQISLGNVPVAKIYKGSQLIWTNRVLTTITGQFHFNNTDRLFVTVNGITTEYAELPVIINTQFGDHVQLFIGSDACSVITWRSGYEFAPIQYMSQSGDNFSCSFDATEDQTITISPMRIMECNIHIDPDLVAYLDAADNGARANYRVVYEAMGVQLISNFDKNNTSISSGYYIIYDDDMPLSVAFPKESIKIYYDNHATVDMDVEFTEFYLREEEYFAYNTHGINYYIY